MQIHVLRRRRGQRRVGERGEPLVRRRRTSDLGRRPPHRVPQQGNAPWMNRDRGTVKRDLRFKSCKNTFSFDSPSIERGRKREGGREREIILLLSFKSFVASRHFPDSCVVHGLRRKGGRPMPRGAPLPSRLRHLRASVCLSPLSPPALGGQVFLHVS